MSKNMDDINSISDAYLGGPMKLHHMTDLISVGDALDVARKAGSHLNLEKIAEPAFRVVRAYLEATEDDQSDDSPPDAPAPSQSSNVVSLFGKGETSLGTEKSIQSGPQPKNREESAIRVAFFLLGVVRVLSEEVSRLNIEAKMPKIMTDPKNDSPTAEKKFCLTAPISDSGQPVREEVLADNVSRPDIARWIAGREEIISLLDCIDELPIHQYLETSSDAGNPDCVRELLDYRGEIIRIKSEMLSPEEQEAYGGADALKAEKKRYETRHFDIAETASLLPPKIIENIKQGIGKKGEPHISHCVAVAMRILRKRRECGKPIFFLSADDLYDLVCEEMGETVE